MSKNWADSLNPEQKEAALHTDGPLLILAGAGSGKTTVLISRTGIILEKGLALPQEIAVMTFTNKAARELKSRVRSKLGSSAEKIWAGTFHSFGLNIIRKYHKEFGLNKYFGIIDQSDQTSIIKEVLSELRNSGKEAFDTNTLASMLSSWRELGQTKAKSDDEYEIVCEWLLPKYNKKLEHLGVVDFDLLLHYPLQLMKRNSEIKQKIQSQYKYVMVDEFQDTNLTQMQLVDHLVESHKNVAVVGDDDQSIYGWRGACINNILNFPNRYRQCQVVRLERNYRSSPLIIDLANFVISKNTQRHDKKLLPQTQLDQSHKPELFVFENEDMECEGVLREIKELQQKGYPASQIAVLYRSNTQGALMEAELRKSQIPYNISGGTGFFDRKEIKDILSYLKCSLHPHEVALRRIINTPARGIGESSLEALHLLAKSNNIAFSKTLLLWREANVNPKAGEQIEAFVHGLKQLKMDLVGSASPREVLLAYLQNIRYKQYLMDLSKNELGLQKRWAMIEIFCQVMEKSVLKFGPCTIDSLTEFITFMELRDQEDEEEQKEQVQLMTLHASKGLEFDAVILLGLDEDILPHKTLGQDLTEERRLFYVGITRARKHLVLTRAKSRKRHGRLQPMTPSRFITEIPAEKLTIHGLGWRPVNENQRSSMLQALYKKLENPNDPT